MEGKKKEPYKNEVFKERFRKLCYKKGNTQEEFADLFAVSRPTVAGWLTGKGYPTLHALTKIAQYFNVSTDYLLGISDVASPDITVQAAMKYTGLSEAAVNWLHIGLDDFTCDGIGLSEEMKSDNLRIASALIQNKAFTDMVHNLRRISQSAYMQKLLVILDEQYSECASSNEDDDFFYAKKDDRAIVESTLLHVLYAKGMYEEGSLEDEINSMTDDDLAGGVIHELLSARDKNERHQFLAAKAFNRYIDQLVEESYKKAEQRFEK